jgi:CRP/FNR family cyclic AMP-dependent transcriptional regulator
VIWSIGEAKDWVPSFREMPKSTVPDRSIAMSLIPDTVVFQKRLAALPLATYQAGETVFAAGSRTGRLLILRKGAVAIVKEAIEIAKVAEPGAVFGELSALLDQPHTADVRALETSQFHVADAASLLGQDPIALLYVAVVLARRLDGANQALIELKSQVQAGQPPSVIGKTVEKMEGLLGESGAGLYAGDPYDSYA